MAERGPLFLKPRAWTAAPFGSALLVLAFGLLVLASTRRETGGARMVEHTHEVIETSQAVLARLMDAETGGRGFVITGNSEYLQPYNATARDVARDLSRLRALTADNPRQQVRLDTLDGLASRLLRMLSARIALRQASGFVPVPDSVAWGDARARMDSVHSVIASLEATEGKLLLRRQRNEVRFDRAVLWVVLLGTLGAAALAGSIAGALSRYASGEHRLVTLLDEQNEALEQQTVELEAAQAQLLQRTADAESANRAKSEFLARMSHELRTPLNAIGGYVELIEMGIRGPVTSAQQVDLGRIQQSSRHLLGLINDLLNMARLEAGHIEYERVPVGAAEIVAEVAPMVEPQARAQGLELRHEGCADGVRLLGDREKCRQILINLLGNACKFTPSGGKVTVTCRAEGDLVFIDVADTGPGIPSDKLNAIFDPFVQVQQGAAELGIGLGLPISRDLARGMAGDLTVTSRPGAGSTFTVSLPRAT